MPGFLKPLRSSPAAILFLAAIFAAAIVGGCKSTNENERPETTEMSMKQFLDKYEKTFRPSDYDTTVGAIRQEEQQQRRAVEAALISATAVPETIPGFRVQVLFTADIQQANTIRDTLSEELPDEWVYVVYDSPYYKVRVGNYAERSDANSTLRKLIDLGHKDAWIVPDKIIKNPPPKPPESFIEPERH